jgi:hypothetical protein
MEISPWMLVTIVALVAIFTFIAGFALGMFFFAYLTARREVMKDLKVPEKK